MELNDFSVLRGEPAQQDQFRAVTGQRPSKSKWISLFKGAGLLPVEQVSWGEAAAFCNALSVREDLVPAYSGEALVPDACGYRLPTEAEWEHACRADTITPYWSGDTPYWWTKAGPVAVAWFNSNSGRCSHPVREKPANPWGLYDMHGNVWEWCHDWYGVYPSDEATDPAGPAEGSRRVIRGGSFRVMFPYCRSMSRLGRPPNDRTEDRGFRVARPLINLGRKL